MPLLPDQSFTTVSREVAGIVQDFPLRRRWWVLLGLSALGVVLFVVSATWLFTWGVGVWGLDIPVAWGLAIVNVVWWIGLGHAGTFISAMLLLLGQPWRNSLNRVAEAMTVFAVLCAVLWPILHLGRPWMFYYMLPYPNTLEVQPQFRSPLLWDVFAFGTYFTVSVIFWYVGMIPDLATLRDRARSRAGQVVYGVMALGWRGSARHWQRWRQAYLLVAGLAMPLVVSVHSGVSLLFAVGPVTGWHSTIFPPFFVMGAVYSGFAMVLLIAIALRATFRLQAVLTERHLDLLGKWVLLTGLCTGYGYASETFVAWYSGDAVEWGRVLERTLGTYAGVTWFTYAVNLGVIHLLWLRRVRTSPRLAGIVAALVVVAMYTERYMLVITSLYHGWMPGKWRVYVPTFWDWAIYFGTVGLFFFLMLLFIRWLPAVAIAEVKEVVMEQRHAD
ncbi:MAG: NrfD/PsrC family molybdoenzyme membrane anchor subunit [Actinomycetota bacterium]